MADDLGSKNVIEALLAQQNNPNKLAVVNYALGYFSNKGISHLAKRTSQLYMIQRRTTVDGSETIQDLLTQMPQNSRGSGNGLMAAAAPPMQPTGAPTGAWGSSDEEEI